MSTVSSATCGEVAAALDGATLEGDASTTVTGVAHDSRAVRPGDLFCCVVGSAHDGHDHAPDAVGSGAVALLVERPLDLEVPQIVVASVRAAMGPAASLVAGRPSESLQVIGVTGTNGKTTVAHLLSHLSNAVGVRTEVIGTLTGVRTTPEGPELQRQLAGYVENGVTRVAMEVSSHALDLHRVDGTRFVAAVFTNLGADHLDHHGTIERYFAAKSRLFDPRFTDLAMVNLDDVHGRLLRDAAAVPTRSYSLDDVSGIERTDRWTGFTWRGRRCRLPLVGDFNISNALAALETLVELGDDPDRLADALADFEAPAGRMQPIDEGQPFAVFVDFAHTPDALGVALASAREVARGSVRVVFGCGGDRDRAKRPEMGRVAARLADEVVVTSDNSRDESPASIVDDIVGGVVDSSPTVVLDRAAAIHTAIGHATDGDVVLIAGKGHETTQVEGGRSIEFDDREVARAALRSLGYGPDGAAIQGAAG